MKPDVTFLTSSELQEALGNSLDEDEEDELRRFRDRVLESFRNLDEALEVMEDVYGRGWKSFDIGVWVFDSNQDSVSSPILLKQQDIETAVFEAFWMLSKRMIRDDPPDSDLVAEGYRKLDAVSALLASHVLEQVMDEGGYRELEDAIRSESEDIKIWRAVDEFGEEWDADEETLYEWLEGR